ncbi:MAG: response regulator [candidate division Zixibacteria bacterium]|nr:response regulator [candidate division Zixibacteria bacterium]
MQEFSILLVDDSESMLKALTRVFKYSENHELFTALDGKGALDILGSQSIDLIITDENMPNMSGTELLNTVRTLYPHVMRFMLTGETDIEIAKRAINDGQILRFFTKPFDEFELLIAVKYAFDLKKLERENSRLKEVVKEQGAYLKNLEAKYPGIASKKLSEDGAYILDGAD